MIELRPVFYILGFLITALAAAMLVPLGVSIALDDGDWWPFLAGSSTTMAIGVGLLASFRADENRLERRQAFLLTCFAWLIAPLMGAIPILLSESNLRLVDAVFESTSGLTTTGSTVLSDLDSLAPSLLVWRSLLQWLGGIGIIAMGIAILPFLRVGGMQIFRTESSDQNSKMAPTAVGFVARLLATYIGLTVLCAVAFEASGMTFFEAINHAMTTISTGGYSTSDLSFGQFQNAPTQWIATFFMLAGSLPFALYIPATRGRLGMLFGNSQVQVLIALLVAMTLVMSTWLVLFDGVVWVDALRLCAFNIVSVVTTTGFATEDYTLWGPLAVTMFFFLTFVGACSGSTSGGFKIYRLQIVAQLVRRSWHRLISPHEVVLVTFNQRPVDEETLNSVATFILLFAGTILALAMFLGWTGLDLETALSGAATAVSNVGPGIGPIIGPAGNFFPLPDAAKWALCLGMILGRLEIATIAVLLLPSFWRN